MSMRNRKEIENDAMRLIKVDETLDSSLLEVLLDIRDLLQKPPTH